jgi:peptidyl-prolyl cis-trans isomerase SurA
MNQIKSLLSIAAIVGSFLATAQESKTFIDFGNEKVSKAEFKRVYLKNNSGEMVSKSTVDEYLDLYINFKLKVKEAEAKGLDTIQSFQKELAGYRKQLAQPYLSADGVMEELKKEAYSRMEQEVSARHILIKVDLESSAEDTMKAYKKAEKVLKELKDGADFVATAKKYSDDPSAKNNGGDLGYFTAFQMVYPFESAAFNTKVGAVSDIVRSQFGYHIIKVEDKRPSSGEVTVAHILISTDLQFNKGEDAQAKIIEIYGRLQNGDPFEVLAKNFSDDTRSAQQGGKMPSFGVGRMVSQFEEVAFSLEEEGQYSEPFQTQYGWHIVKLLGKEKIGSYKSMENEIINRIKRDNRSKLTEGAVLRKIKKQYGFSQELKERNDFYDLISESYFKGEWDVKEAKKLKKELFRIGDKKVSQTDFAKYLDETQRKRKSIDVEVLINSKYNEFVRQTLMNYKDARLESEQPEFAALMKEYRDGILLFNLTDETVWSKAVEDTSGLEAFYKKNKENYRWEKRVDAVVYSAINKDIAKKAKAMIQKGAKQEEVVEAINQSSQLNLKTEQKKYEKGDKSIVDQVNWKEGVSKNIEEEGRQFFVHIKEVIKPSYKTLDDARGIITSDYQSYLEKKWIESLRSKYEFSVDTTVLKELKSELK